jgi:hypothetical protein
MRRGGDPPRKSMRNQSDVLHIEAHALGGETTRIDMPDKKILEFINYYIKPNVPVIVSVPIRPERHAFLVLVLEKEQKIMVADWGVRDIKELKDDDNWVVYVKFVKKLLEKYTDYKLEFFPVDDELYKEADAHHKKNNIDSEDEGGFGGCSYYIYKWKDKHMEILKNLINRGSGREGREGREERKGREVRDEPAKMTKRSKPEEPEEPEKPVKMARRSKPEEPEEPKEPEKMTRRSKTWFW